jgi:hypothetical protein
MPTTTPDAEDELWQGCGTVGEVLLAASAIYGLAGVEFLLQQTAEGSTRESLREAAQSFKRVGLTEMADLVRAHVGRAKRRRPGFNKVWHVARRQGTGR